MNYLDAIALMSTTGDINTAPPANTGLSDNFKVSYSPDDSFKKYVKRDASLFANFKGGKH